MSNVQNWRTKPRLQLHDLYLMSILSDYTSLKKTKQTKKSTLFKNWMLYYTGRTINVKHNMSHVTTCACTIFDLRVCTYLKLPTLVL